ncbi:type II toxin-antitoxin system HipA family toxin [Hyphococcus sp.]|uniref:type II toxin-antitoxin system HipA family toxin n=1 Tax=Hyphococcus sp. TaxID=2038636 RepID=UPI003CCC1C04
MTDARVMLWGREIGAVSWLEDREVGVFQYAPEFVQSGIEVAPLMMPLREAPYEFPGLPREAFKGLPGLLADSLPDKFGNALIDAWLARQGRTPESFNPVERLCYIGVRGMGALEFQPAILDPSIRSKKLEVAALVELANKVLDERVALEGKFAGSDDAKVIEDIIRVGTSAGGARAKAILAWNEKTGEFRSGQVPADDGFSYWLMKFDGVTGNKDKELADPQGYGLIEFAYYLMAKDAGIGMMECRLHKEGGRAHFMTKRFDRTDAGEKLHMQSLCAMMHFDFNQPDAYSYEQALQTIRRIGMPMADMEEQFRRAVFNVIARNHDDHVKNIAYLMNKQGDWRLSPAFDVAYSYNPSGAWTSRHQMSINGKRDGFDIDDLLALARSGAIKPAKARDIIEEVDASVGKWRSFVKTAGIDDKTADRIERAHRRLSSLQN